MSFSLMNDVLQTPDLPISSTELFVLVGIAYFCNDTTGESFPSIAKLSKLTKLSERAIFKAIKQLEDKNIVSRSRDKSVRLSNSYQINRTFLSQGINSENKKNDITEQNNQNTVYQISKNAYEQKSSTYESGSYNINTLYVQRSGSTCTWCSQILNDVQPNKELNSNLSEKEINKEKEYSDHALPFVSGKTQNSVETLHSKNLNPNITAENQTSRLAQENLSLTKGKQGISVSTVESVPTTESSPLSFGEGEKINPCDAPQNPSLTKKSVNDIADKQTNPVVTETTQPTVSCVGHGVSNEKQASCAQTASYQSTSRTNSKETDADCLSGDLFGFMEDSAPNRESVTSVRTIQGSYELPHPETKKMVKIEADFVRTEKPEEVSLEVWNDFIAFRRKKGKKSYITDGLIEKYSSIARQAGFSLEAVIQNCIDRDWQGINDAKWLLNSPPKPEGYTADFQYWKDFCFNCADKRKPMTKTRVEAFKQKVAQSGVSLNDAVQCCAEKGYADFVYPEYLKWLSERKGTNFGYKRFSAQSESQNGSPNNTNNVPTGSIFRWFASKSA